MTESIEIVLPLEFVVEGTAVAKAARSNDDWETRVREAAREAIGNPSAWTIDVPLFATVYIFPRAPLAGDLDNKLKSIFDALKGIVYVDDDQIERIDALTVRPDRNTIYSRPSPLLIETAEGDEECVYIRFTDDLNEGRER